MTNKTVAIHPFSRCQVEKAKPELLQSALNSAMSDFGDKVEEELAPSSPNARRRSSVEYTAAASRRNLERDVARDGGARISTPGSMRLKIRIRNIISALHLRTSSRVAVHTPAVVLQLPDRWMLIWTMLISDPDEAMRGVARQASHRSCGGPAPKPSYDQPSVRAAALSLHCGVPHATPPPRAVAGLR